METKTLESERLILRSPSIEDAEALFEFKKLPELYTYTINPAYESFDVYKEMLKENIDSDYAFWVIETKEENMVVGEISIENPNKKYKNCDVGILISPEHGGKGYATEAVLKLLEYLKENKYHRVGWNSWDGNIASMRLAEKCGFQKEAVLKDARFKDGKFYNLHIFAKILD